MCVKMRYSGEDERQHKATRTSVKKKGLSLPEPATMQLSNVVGHLYRNQLEGWWPSSS